jgi:predicted transglutaminase-like cysteine proteinase
VLQKRRLSVTIVALVFAIVLPPAGPAGANRATHEPEPAPQLFNIFGPNELKAVELGVLPQWTRLLSRMDEAPGSLARCWSDAADCTSPQLERWRGLVEDIAADNRDTQLRAVNTFFNRWPYKQDRALYGVREYWATPAEFMARAGDCEDFAIAKYFTLRALGYPDEALRIIVLYDRIRGVGHAVLAVLANDDILILDNQSDQVFSHARYRHYVPWYAMNQETFWTTTAPYLTQILPRDILPGHSG